MPITPVLLCGGSGTRLWPRSRKSCPRQFAALTGDESLFQASARRLAGPGFAAPVVVTNAEFRFVVTGQLMQARIDPGAIQIEPEGRNTAPAVLAAALHAAATDPDAVLQVAPSDHVIPDAARFGEALHEPACCDKAFWQCDAVLLRRDLHRTHFKQLTGKVEPGMYEVFR